MAIAVRCWWITNSVEPRPPTQRQEPIGTWSFDVGYHRLPPPSNHTCTTRLLLFRGGQKNIEARSSMRWQNRVQTIFCDLNTFCFVNKRITLIHLHAHLISRIIQVISLFLQFAVDGSSNSLPDLDHQRQESVGASCIDTCVPSTSLTAKPHRGLANRAPKHAVSAYAN